MTSLPIVERELRVRARLRSTYQLRMLTALAAFVVVLLLCLASGKRINAGQYGGVIFRFLAWLAFIFCLMEGMRTTADCLSEEKREGTLGLLFLTDLRPYDVVVGKLIASSLNSVYGLMAILPPMAIPLLIGGVLFDEFWRLVLVLVNTLFFSLTLGMAVSAGTRDERRSWTRSATLLLGLGVVPALLLALRGWGSSWLAALSPTTGFLHVFDAAYGAAPDRYWRSVGSAHLMGWGFLIAATFLLPRRWQDQPPDGASPLGSRVRRWWRGRSTGPADLARREMILNANPAVWLVVRGQRQQGLLWLIVLGASGCAVLAWVLTAGSSWMAGGILGILLLLHLALAAWVATEACHLLPVSRDSGALELLLCTPLTPKEIVDGHLEGLKQQFLLPVAVLVTVECLLLAGQIYVLGMKHEVSAPLCAGIALAVGLCVTSSILDLVAVARYGIWQGLANRNTGRAVTKTILFVVVLPLAGVLLFTFGGLLPVVGVVKNLIVINYAQQQMRKQFRPLLTGRYGWSAEADRVDQPKKPPRIERLPTVWPN